MTPERLKEIKEGWNWVLLGKPDAPSVQAVYQEAMELISEVERLRKVQEGLFTDNDLLTKRVDMFRTGLKKLLVRDLTICECNHTPESDEEEP